MNTTTIAIQKNIRDKAMNRAKQEGFSLGTIVKILLNDYIEGHICIGTKILNNTGVEKAEYIPVDKETQEMMDRTVSELHQNISE